jgi:ribosomal protein L11 methyltransferase
MQQIFQFNFVIEEGEEREILIARLELLGFEGFEERGKEILGYIKTAEEALIPLENKLNEIAKIYSVSIVEDKNWNEIWESGFEPVTINDLEGKPFVHLRAEFHAVNGKAPIELVITPRMSFGTGHHATTSLMISSMRELDFAGKKVLDFGTGTGVLAILAEKLGATSVLAIDNDEWSIKNAAENIRENDCREGTIILEKAASIPENHRFDIILANINLNIILESLDRMFLSLLPGGTILLSGLLEQDESTILNQIPDRFHSKVLVRKLNGWLVIRADV